MADLVTRLRLDSQEFDDNIRRSRLLIQNFQNIQSSVTSSIKALGGQFLAAAGLVETFSTAINSNSTLLETWSDVCGTAKESVDSFFTSLTSGDWSIFEKGITNAIKLSRQYTQSMRELRTSIKIGDVRLSQDEKELNKYENLASDESRSKGDREAAYATFKKKGEETVAYVDNLSKYVNNKLTKVLEAKGVHNTKPVREMIFEYLDPSTVGNQLLTKYTVLYDLVQKAYQGTKAVATNPLEALAKSMATENLKKYQAKLESFKKAFPLVEEAYRLKLNFSTLEELDELLDLTDKIIGYEDRLESAKKLITDVSKDFDKNGKLKPKKTDEIIPKGSLKELDKLIADKRVEISLATDDISRAKLYKELKELEEKKRVIKFELEYPYRKGSEFIKDVNNKNDLQSIINGKNNKGNWNKMPIDLPKGNDKNFKKGAKAADKYADALSNCASAVAAFNSLKLEDTGEGWTQWSSNLLAAAASTIIGLQSLTMAKGVNSAFDLPFPANLAAAALVLSTVISLFASIPAFAEGGIFQSSLTTGDKNLARLNGGEMILNKGLQYNLFKLLDNGSSINGGGEVTFKLRGSDIYGSLSNYNKKFSKVR